MCVPIRVSKAVWIAEEIQINFANERPQRVRSAHIFLVLKAIVLLQDKMSVPHMRFHDASKFLEIDNPIQITVEFFNHGA